MTNNLEARVLKHKALVGAIFPSKYKATDLLYYERIHGMMNCIDREKQLKNWHKEWKWNLIKEENPELIDLAKDWYTEAEIEEMRINNTN
tara:strand:- start:1530 stop:1799 length:270 start_codon:yes stop_codon:yes gene_type:complete